MKKVNKSIKIKIYLPIILFLGIVIFGIFKAIQSYTKIDLGTIKFCATLCDLNKTFLLYNSNQIIPPSKQLYIWGKYPYVYGYYTINEYETNYFIFDERNQRLKTTTKSANFHKALFENGLILHRMYGLWDLKQKCFRNELKNLKMSLRKQ